MCMCLFGLCQFTYPFSFCTGRTIIVCKYNVHGCGYTFRMHTRANTLVRQCNPQDFGYLALINYFFQRSS